MTLKSNKYLVINIIQKYIATIKCIGLVFRLDVYSALAEGQHKLLNTKWFLIQKMTKNSNQESAIKCGDWEKWFQKIV